MDNNNPQKLWLLGQKNIQNSLLLGYLQQNINLSCEIFDPNLRSDFSDTSPDNLVCIDATALKFDRCKAILEQLSGSHKAFFINLDPASEYEHLLHWPCVCGFFYKGASHNLVSKGIASILNGELWFNRTLLARFMANNRKPPVKSTSNVYNLTKREKQILNLSASGAKNADIADALNVSTHTVKTHMYNLFKKIDVSNRIQAINWAKEYLTEQDLRA